jgi:hypothetical protein
MALIQRQAAFTGRVWTPVGLVTYHVLFFIDLATHRVEPGGVTRFTCPGWLGQVLRNVTMVVSGFLEGCRYLLHDRDPRYDEREPGPVLEAVGIKPLKLPAHAPNLNAEAERFIRSVRQECLNRVVLFGEASLRRALSEYLRHYNHERNHQGMGTESWHRGPRTDWVRPPSASPDAKGWEAFSTSTGGARDEFLDPTRYIREE